VRYERVRCTRTKIENQKPLRSSPRNSGLGECSLQEIILEKILQIMPMILSLTVHEWAHAASAYYLGDDTAEKDGRLTLNPIVHIDPVGTILLPLLGIPFGYAKPVPVNPMRFTRKVSMRTGMALTAAAGPISNFLLALLATVGLGLWLRFGGAYDRTSVVKLVPQFIVLNVSLCLFNFIPIPPLDGSRIASRFFGQHFPSAWGFIENYSRYLIIAVFMGAGRFLAGPTASITAELFKLIRSIAG
jgi:Zn-dependent protease